MSEYPHDSIRKYCYRGRAEYYVLDFHGLREVNRCSGLLRYTRSYIPLAPVGADAGGLLFEKCGVEGLILRGDGIP